VPSTCPCCWENMAMMGHTMPLPCSTLFPCPGYGRRGKNM
jgi:hypothetical protein